MTVKKQTSKTIVPFVLLLLSSLLVSCTAFSGLAWPPDAKAKDRKESVTDTIPRIKELECRDIFEQARKEQWDSIKVADFGQPYVNSYPNTLADSIIEYAKLFLGTPYAAAGKGPNRFDCSGFTAFVFRHFGYELRATSKGQLDDGWKVVTRPDELRCGDLVFFGGRSKTREIGHVGIVVSNDPVRHSFTFIHASVRLGVTISGSTESYYYPRYITACRVLPE
ncbi:MAG: C40 family peptidase [Bacteroidales bacterium]|nr:C40 family peptidase [Bacteroidales bacterium]